LSLNFSGTGDGGGQHQSVRSGVFGGYNQSGTSSSHPSFRNEMYSSNKEKLEKMATKGHHSRKGTFGGQTTEDLMKLGGESPVTLTKINQMDNIANVNEEYEDQEANKN
jgi:hypothetical protein